MYLFNLIAGIIKAFAKKAPIQVPVINPQPMPDPIVNQLSTPPLPPVITPAERLYTSAVAYIGVDASPTDFAPDEYGCMESVDSIYYHAFGRYIGGGKTPCLSTKKGFELLKASPHFEIVLSPIPGCIIISPTDYGNGDLANGHTGIVAKFGIMSNDSETGKWQKNYTTDAWRARYVYKGGFPMVYFKPI